MDLQAIQRMSENEMSNFEGQIYPQITPAMYTGFGDDMVDFDGKQVGFAESLATSRIYSFTITNASGALRNILLSPSYAPATNANTFVIAEGTIAGAGGVTANGSPSSIAEFLAWINLNPTHVMAFRISSQLTSQLQVQATIERRSPFKKLANEYINIGSFVNEANNNDKLVTVNRPFQLDNQTQFSIPVPDTAVTTITLFCGGVLNTAAALNNKVNKAAVTQARG